MNKSDYDKYYKKGGTYVIPIEAFNEVWNELERLSFNYEQALEDLDKKENIIKEVREYIEKNSLYEEDYDYDYEENLVVGPPSDETARKILLKILDKEVN